MHYPTDINLLSDAIRKTIETCAKLCAKEGLSDWRQSRHNLRVFKKAYRRTQNLKRSHAKDSDKRAARQREIEQAYRDYLQLAEMYLTRARYTRDRLQIGCALPEILLVELDSYIVHAERQIDQIRRRVLLGQRIAHDEKVFSIFQPHTEWIVKGKAGVPVELGLRVAVVEDQYRFILNHRVMEKCTDDQVAVSLIAETRACFPEITSASMDKGFHSPSNQKALAEIVDLPVVPKKGKRSKAECERESHPEFIRLRRRHSAVESAINALESHGLDICRDSGLDGFKRYVAMAVVARNIQRIGAILQERDAEREKRRRQRVA